MRRLTSFIREGTIEGDRRRIPMKDTFLMIDGNSLLHRAFHALPLMDAGGVYTNAIYGLSLIHI